MPHGRHHNPHVEGKLVSATLLEEPPHEEHAGRPAELHDGAFHTLQSKCKMLRGVERDGIEVRNMTDLVLVVHCGSFIARAPAGQKSVST